MIYEFAATQDLHGWGKPWAPGAGVNLVDAPDVDVKSQSTIATITLEDGTYSFSCYLKDLSNIGGTFGVYEGASQLKGTSFAAGTNGTIKVENITIAEDKTFRMVISGNSSGYHYKVSQIQCEKGASATSYAPYSNVCMPEGFNIWDPDQQDYTQIYAGYVNTATRELFLRPVYTEYDGEELVGPWMSDIDEYSEDATPTEGAFVIDFGGDLTSYEITAFMLQTLLDSLGIRPHFTDGAGLLNKLMDQAQGRVRSEEELLHLSRPLNVIAIGDQLPAGITFKPISKDVLPGLPGKFIR